MSFTDSLRRFLSLDSAVVGRSGAPPPTQPLSDEQRDLNMARETLSALQDEAGRIADHLGTQLDSLRHLAGLDFPTPSDLAEQETVRRQVAKLEQREAEVRAELTGAEAAVRDAERKFEQARVHQERLILQQEAAEFRVLLREFESEFRRQHEVHAQRARELVCSTWVERTRGDLVEALTTARVMDRADSVNKAFEQMEANLCELQRRTPLEPLPPLTSRRNPSSGVRWVGTPRNAD